MRDDLKDEFVCMLHNRIIKIAQRALRQDEVSDHTLDLLEIIELTRAAKQKAKRMESRLVRYYQAITSIGFIRKRSHKV